MAQETRSEAAQLWQQFGLEELRLALQRVSGLTQRFEQTLKALPSCNTCARGQLLERIRRASHELSSELGSLAVLAEALHGAVDTVGRIETALIDENPTPCRCAGEPCRCHQ